LVATAANLSGLTQKDRAAMARELCGEVCGVAVIGIGRMKVLPSECFRGVVGL
jgi:hypothetical protein